MADSNILSVSSTTRYDRGKRKERHDDADSESSSMSFSTDNTAPTSQVGTIHKTVLSVCFSEVDPKVKKGCVQCNLMAITGTIASCVGPGKKFDHHLSYFMNQSSKSSLLYAHLRKFHPDDMKALIALNGKPLLEIQKVVSDIATKNNKAKSHMQNRSISSFFLKKASRAPAQVKTNISAILLAAEKDCSIELVTSDAVDRLIRSAGGSVLPEGRTTLSEKYLNICYMVCKKYLRSGYESVQGLNFTIDGWTDAVSRKYIGLTYHFIEDSLDTTKKPIWVLRNSSSNIIPLFDNRSTALLIADMVRDRINGDFPFDTTTIGTGVSDRGANYHLAANLIESSLEIGSNTLNVQDVDLDDNEEIGLGEEVNYHHHSCVDHALHNAVKDAFGPRGICSKTTRNAIESTRSSISYIRSSDLYTKFKVEAAKDV